MRLFRAVAIAIFLLALQSVAHATQITIAQTTIGGWRNTATSPQLRIYLNKAVTTNDGTVLQPGSPQSSGGFYVVASCSVLSNVLTINAVTLDSTTDALVGNDATYSAYFYASSTATASQIGVYQGFSKFAIPPLPLSTTWSAILQYNNTFIAHRDPFTFSREQILSLLAAAAGVPLTRTVSTTAPLAGGGALSSNLTLSIPAASGSQNGYLASGDWTTFNSKQAAGNYVTAGTGDVVFAGPGSVPATIQTNVVSDTKLRQSTALSVIGRSANSTGNVADIVAGSDFNILRRSGSAIGFGSIDLSQSGAVGSSILGFGNGGTGSPTQNFVDLTTNQTVGGAKTVKVYDAGGAVWNVKAAPSPAIGDGVADDTAAILAHIAAAVAGDTILFPPGVYLTTTITMADKGLRFIGSGESMTTIRAKTGTTGRLLYINNTVVQGAIRIEGIALDLSLAPTIVGLEMKKYDTTVVQNLRVQQGSYGIKLVATGGAAVGSSTFENIILRDQTTAGISVDADTNAENKFIGFDINCTAGLGTCGNGFELLRTTAGDVGGNWLERVKVVGAGFTNGIKISSSAANSSFFVFLSNCTADLIGGGNALLLTNAARVRVENGHFYSSHASALGAKIDGGSKITAVNNYFGSNSGGVDFANANTTSSFAANTTEGTYAFKMPGASSPSSLDLASNATTASTLTNDFDKLAVAGSLRIVGGMTVLTSFNGGANSTFAIRNAPGGQTFYIRGGGSGGIEFINNAFSLSVAQITDAGIFSGAGFRIGGTAASGNVLRGNGTDFVSSTLAFADLSSKPTTFGGYGISDSSANLRAALSDEKGTGVALFDGASTVGFGITPATSIGIGGTNTPVQIHNSSGGFGLLSLTTSSTADAADIGVLAFGSTGLSDSDKRLAQIDAKKVGAATSSSSGSLKFTTWNGGTAGTRMLIDNVGNIKIAGSAVRGTTEGTNHLDIYDGTAPVGTLAAGISLYSTSGQLYAMNSAGVATQLTSIAQGCRVYNSANIAITTGTPTMLTFDSERWDTNSFHSTVTNTSRITFPVAGVYLVVVNLEMTASALGTFRQVQVVLNGTTTIASLLNTPLAAANRLNLSTTYRVAAADYAEIQVYHDAGSNQNVLASANYSAEVTTFYVGP